MRSAVDLIKSPVSTARKRCWFRFVEEAAGFSQALITKEKAMWHVDLGLALAWFTPIMLGFLIGFVLLRFSEDRGVDDTYRPERRDRRRNDLARHA